MSPPTKHCKLGAYTMQIHPPRVLRTRHLRSGGPRAGLPAEAPEECPSPLFQLLGAPGVRPGLVAASLPSLAPSPHGFSTVSLFCVLQGPVVGFRATLNQEEPRLRPFTSAHLQGSYFWTRSYPEVLAVTTCVQGAPFTQHMVPLGKSVSP